VRLDVIMNRMSFVGILLKKAFMWDFVRLRQSGKKKKRFRMKKPGGKKDEMKLALLKLKSIVQQDQTDGSALAIGYDSSDHDDSGSDRGSMTRGHSPKI